MDIQIPGYEVKSEIGRGGMAIVYLARQKSFGRDVALKVMSPTLAGDEGFTKRFLKEGATVAHLMHPNIIKVFDAGIYDHYYYLAMEYFPSGTLKQRIGQGLPAEDTLHIIKTILGALRYAHGQGLIHRDLKPHNILLYEDGTPVISDFGIVKIVGQKTMLTGTNLSVGSPQYMSPEQIKGDQPVDERSDLYSIGAMFFEMLTGHVPFDAEESFSIAFKHIYDPIPRLPSDLGAFEPFLASLLAKKPADRFPSAAEALAALTAIQYEPSTNRGTTVVLPVQDRPKHARRAQTRPKRSGKTSKFVTLALILVLIGGGGYFYWQRYIVPERQRQAELERQQHQAELERQRQEELERQRQAELERQQQEALERQRQAELERQQEEQRQAEEIERQREEALERQQQAELEGQQQEELERQRQEELEQQRQAQEQYKQKQVAQLLDEARQAQQAGDLTLSLERIAVGLALMPDSQDLLALLEQVQQQLASRRAQQEVAEQQRQVELERERQEQLERQRQEELQRQAELERQRQEEQQQAELERQQQEARRRQTEQQINTLLTTARQQFAAGNYSASLQQLDELLVLQSDHAQVRQLKSLVQAAQEEDRLGLSRSQRQDVQQTLTDLGFDPQGVDGIFGANSRRAIAAFQKQKNLPATGYLNAAQFALLQPLKPQPTAASEEETKQDSQTTLPRIDLVSTTSSTNTTAKAETRQETPSTTPPQTTASTPETAPSEWRALESRLASFKNTAERFLRQARIRSAPPRRPAAATGCQGDCSNGQGTYVFDTGDIYVGSWRNNDRHGQGIYFHSDGSVYEGAFNRNVRSGTGAFYYASGDVYYGSWQGGNRHGRGIYYYANGIRLYGDFRNGRLQGDTVAVFHNNDDVYVGRWRNDSKNGKGVYYESSGRKYAGEWRNNVKIKVVDLN